MSETLSSNTKAILLLTAPLIAGGAKKSTDLLTPSEYKRLARHLREQNVEPADLLTPGADHLLSDCAHLIDKARLERLVARGLLLSQAVEHWHARAIWVLSRADATYPQRLKMRLREDSPAVLYGCGDKKILDSGGLAVVGSRSVDDALIEYTEAVGRLAASAGRTIVSGGARGIDQAAMRGALEAGGTAMGVMADALERAAMQREHRNLLLEGQLVLISPYDPSAGFNVGHAMQRNKSIYALADAAFVVGADLDKGGTWAGATEQLDRLRLVPVFVRTTGRASPGLDGLLKKGALPWPEPTDAGDLEAAIAAPGQQRAPSLQPSQLSFTSTQGGAGGGGGVRDADAPSYGAEVASPAPDVETGRAPAEELFRAVRSLVLRLVREPMTAAEVARHLEVSEPQVKNWLKRLVGEGTLKKSRKPVRYSVCQASLFESESIGARVSETKPARSGK